MTITRYFRKIQFQRKKYGNKRKLDIVSICVDFLLVRPSKQFSINYFINSHRSNKNDILKISVQNSMYLRLCMRMGVEGVQCMRERLYLRVCIMRDLHCRYALS